MKISAVKCAKFLCAVSLVVVSVHVLQLDHARASDGLVTDIATWRHGIRHAVWSAASGADNTASFTQAGYNEDWAELLRLLGLAPCNILDIGANDGDTTLNLALAAAGGTVLAFEMGPQVELLNYNVR